MVRGVEHGRVSGVDILLRVVAAGMLQVAFSGSAIGFQASERDPAGRNFALGFGRAVCALPSADEQGSPRFVVAAPGGYEEQDPGVLFFFEGFPPKLSGSARGLPGHALAKSITVVEIQGKSTLLLESDYVGRRVFHLYSMAGEWISTLPRSLGLPVPVGARDGDGSSDFCVQVGTASLQIVDWRGHPVATDAPGVGGVLLGALGGHAAGILCRVVGEGPPRLGVAGKRLSGYDAVLDWSSRPAGSPPLRSLNALWIGSAAGGPRSLCVIADSGWDWPWGLVQAWTVEAGFVQKLYEITDDDGPAKDQRGRHDPAGGTELGFAMILGPDIDGDGWQDIIVSSPSMMALEQVQAFSSVSGKRLWAHASGSPPRWMGASLGLYVDCDQDGLPDVLIGGADYSLTGRRNAEGGVQLLSSKDGRVLWQELVGGI